MPTEETGVITRYEVQGEEKVIRANREIERSTDKVTKAMKDESRAAGLSAKAMIAYSAAALVAARAAQAIFQELRETAVELFENTEEGERLAESYDRLKQSIILALVSFEDTKQLLGEIADGMDDVSAAALRMSEEFVGITAAGAAVESQIPTMDADAAALAEQMAGLGASLGIGRQALVGVGAEMGALGPEMQQLAEETSDVAEAQRRLENETALSTETTRDYSRAVESLARTMRSAASAQAEFAGRQDEITRGAATERVQAATDRFTGLMQVEFDLRAEIADINRDANRAESRATTQHQRNLTRITEQAGRDRAQAIAQNRLREQFDERRFDLSSLQSERLYLAERARLAAQGDVLAIDELDERFALQQVIEEENFRLQQQRQEATFRLQLRFQEEAARQQAQILTEALTEQLRTIEESRQERVAEAEIAAQEERMQVKGEFALEIAAIDAQEKLKLEELEKGWNERLAKDAEKLADFIRQNDLAASDVLEAWRRRFGTGGEFDILVINAISRANALVATINAALLGVSAIRSGGTGFRPGVPIRYRQHGGDEIVSSPTMFMAGEAGPERVVTQPLSSIGGAMTVRWQGGAIPLEGTGGLENLDLAPVGQALAQGLTVSIMEAYLRQRGNWGR